MAFTKVLIALVLESACTPFAGGADGESTDVVVGMDARSQVDGGDSDANIRQLANDLFSNHVFAFELTSVLLVIAVVATVLLARRPRSAAAADIDAGFKSKTGVK